MITAPVVYQIAKELSIIEMEKLQLMLQQNLDSIDVATSNKKIKKITDIEVLNYLLKNTFNCK